MIENGMCNIDEVEECSDIFLVTGSTLCNNSIVSFLKIKKPVIYFGTTSKNKLPLLVRKNCKYVGMTTYFLTFLDYYRFKSEVATKLVNTSACRVKKCDIT